MDPAREKRKEEISKALTFIQSSLAYPDPAGFQDFLIRLVCNLLDEGNALFREGEWELAAREFTEGLNVSDYAAVEDVCIPEALMESLYVNRAAAHHSMGEYERGIDDCDRALGVCAESQGESKALYRKALCLKELGKYKEAYNCTTDCLLISRLDKQVNELAHELAVQLGLKNRKPYVSTKEDALIMRNGSNGNMAAKVSHVGNGINPLSGLAPASVSSVVPDNLDTLEDLEFIGDDLDSLLDCVPNDLEPAQTAFSVPIKTSTCSHTVPPVLPAPTPQLPPAFFTSAVSQLNSLDSFAGGGITTTTSTLDALDDLSTTRILASPNLGLTSAALDSLDGLDSLDDFTDTTPSAAAAENGSKREQDPGEKSLDDLLDELDPLETLPDPGCWTGSTKAFEQTLDQLDSLDALDPFPSAEGDVAALPANSFGGNGLELLSGFNSTGVSGSRGSVAAPVVRPPKNDHKLQQKEKNGQAQVAISNPLASTHEFLQACSACFRRRGESVYSFVHKPDLLHRCKRDILLCRRKADHPSEWTRVRRLPANTSFKGPFVLCKELLGSGDRGVCKFGENCTFAYNQLEIDVWTEERKGTLDRNLMFDTDVDPVNSIICILQENKGMFIFLCQKCYDSKPRIISKQCKENHTVCSNSAARHDFSANKCLAFVVRTHSVNYFKIRPLSAQCQLDLCRQAIRYGCMREDSCLFAHSVMELKTWRVQKVTGICPDVIVMLSTKYGDKPEQNPNKQKGARLSSGGGGGKPKGGVGKSPNMRMKFACAQCWRDGLTSDPDKSLKHCNSKAKHAWTKDRWLLLVKSMERSKWVPVRPLPHAKNFPLYYDICTQILEKRKCNYTGKCTFAHSQEEKEMWMYMKNNGLVEMQQMYDIWQTLNRQTHQADGAILSPAVPEEKSIVMPTDYAEPMSGFHCRLCGKHSNSERQWQQHISTEKHKDRVFSCEGEEEALTWSYRFPGACFQLCPKLVAGCPDGVSCDFAHSPKELQEWTERRDFLRQKLAKAREDMLIMPNESDFGKYNFLLHN